MTNAEAQFNKSLCPRKPEGSLGRTAQDVHLDSHTAPELCKRNRKNKQLSKYKTNKKRGWGVEETNLSSFSASFLATKALNSGVIPKLFSSSFSMTALQQISLKVQPRPTENYVLDSCMLYKGRQAADKSLFLQGLQFNFKPHRPVRQPNFNLQDIMYGCKF